MTVSWEIEITDLSGNGRAAVNNPLDLTMSFQRNGASTLSFGVHAEDDSVAQLLPGTRLVQAWRTDANGTKTIRFHGQLWQRDETLSDGGGVVQVTVADPWAALSRRFTTASYSASDQGAIIQDLIDTANSDQDTRINTTSGSIETTVTRDRSWADNRTAVADAVLSLTNILDACDVELQPIDYASGKIAQLNVYARQGSTTPQAVFGFGQATVANLSSVSRSSSMENIATRVSAYGSGGIVSTLNDATAQAAYDLHVRDQSLQDVVLSQTLTDHAQETLDRFKNPLRRLSISPVGGANSPMLWDDFIVGDAVAVHVDHANIAFTETARVEACTVAVVEGQEQVSSVTVEVEQ